MPAQPIKARRRWQKRAGWMIYGANGYTGQGAIEPDLAAAEMNGGATQCIELDVRLLLKTTDDTLMDRPR